MMSWTVSMLIWLPAACLGKKHQMLNHVGMIPHSSLECQHSPSFAAFFNMRTIYNLAALIEKEIV